MTIAREEIFGPVLSIIPYADEAEAVAIANDTVYGLQAYVLSGDLDRARRVADQILAGRVLINTLAMSRWRLSAASNNPASAANTAISAWKPSSNPNPCSACTGPDSAVPLG